MIPVGWLAPSADCWDANMLRLLLDGELYPHGLDVKHFKGYPPNLDGCILVVPGRYWAEAMPDIEDAVASYKWLLLIRTSDEEDLFDVNQFAGPEQTKFWVQTPRTVGDYGDARLFGVGFTPHFNNLPKDPPGKNLAVFLSAQDTHERRHEAFRACQHLSDGLRTLVRPTKGFTQGMSATEYVGSMLSAAVAPAPSGAVSPDSFRLFEALEAHCVPIADTVSPIDGPTDYWRRLFPDAPFPVLTAYRDMPGYVDDALKDWPRNANRIAAWWVAQKRRYTHWLVDDLKALGAV